MRYLRFLVGVLLSAVCLTQAARAQKWDLSYDYDGDGSYLTIADLQFASPQRGVAVGTIEQKDVKKPVTIGTNDGGRHWAIAPLGKAGTSLFFLDSNNGWMVVADGIWSTPDAGRTWRILRNAPKSIARVYFLDEHRGFAIGDMKSAYRTDDGGKTWQAIAAAAEPETKPENTFYNSITFVTPKVGMISGYSAPPERNNEGREMPHVSIMLDTRDGGDTWKSSTASIFGRITQAMFLRDGRGLGLIEFKDKFQWPSEVHRLDGGSGKSDVAFAQKDRAITDLLMTPSGTSYLAGIEVEEDLQHPVVARRLKILKSTDLSKWDEMDVDPRARALRAMLRRSSDGAMWVATDTGMILKLAE